MAVTEDDDLKRAPSDWRAYLKEMGESVRIYTWVWRELISSRSKKWAKRSTIGLVAVVILSALQPWFLSRAFNGVVAHDGHRVIWGLGAAVGCKLLAQLCHWFHDHWREYALGDNLGQLDRRTSELFFEKSLGQHLRDSGALSAANVEKGRNRTLEVEQLMLFEGVPVVLEILVPWILLWILSPVAGMVMTVLFLNYAGWLLFLNRRTILTCAPIEAEFRKLNRHRTERWDMIERVKTCGKETEEVRHMSQTFDRIMANDRRFWLWFIRVIMIRGSVNQLLTAGIVCYGFWLVWHGDWSVGLLYPLAQWGSQISDNLWRVGQIEHRLNWNMPSVRSMKEALTQQPEVRDSDVAVEMADEGPLRIEVCGVSHDYPRTADEVRQSANKKVSPVLKGVDFSIEPGEKVALLGPSGAGKTTVMRLLQRYTDPRKGGVRVNGHDLRDVRLASWLSHVGYIPQQAQVLDGTLRYNLLYGLPEEARAQMTDEALWTLMRKLQIDFGDRLTDGLETVVGHRGIRLSGGEAQRVMIGAAAAQRPRFLLVDEATSSLDSTTEKAVQHGLAELLGDRSVSALIIAHRLSTVRDLCTKFVVLRGAESLVDGETQIEAVAHSFEELYAISPTFRRLADDQGLNIRKSA